MNITFGTFFYSSVRWHFYGIGIYLFQKYFSQNDLKPCNILVNTDFRAFIKYFGIATMCNTPIDWLRTPEWSSLEQLLYFAEFIANYAHRSLPTNGILLFGLICQAVFDYDITVDSASAHLLSDTGLTTSLSEACNKILKDRRESLL